MNGYVIMTDSSCDLPQQVADELGVAVLPLSVTTQDERVYRNYLDGREISFEDFYSRLRNGEKLTTSAVNVGEFTAAMDPILAGGKDILVLAFSSGLSTTCNSAVLAAEEMEEKYPERKIIVVDTLSASLGQGLVVYLTAKKALRDDLSLEEAADFAERLKLRCIHWFTVADLGQLKRGGRISPTTAAVGNLLGIKPVLFVDDEGHLIPKFKVKGRQASLKKMAELMKEHFDSESPDQAVFISHGDCMDDVAYLEELIRTETGFAGEVIVNYVGPVIASHSGAGTVALFFVGDSRE